MIVNENNSMPYMKSLATCLNRMVTDGYTEDFIVTDNGLEALQHHQHYSPQQIQVVTTYPWLMIPGVFVIVAVLAFNFVGDGLRDAADPYSRA